MIREYDEIKKFLINNISDKVKDIFTDDYNALELEIEGVRIKPYSYVTIIKDKYSYLIKDIEVIENDVMAHGFHKVEYTIYTYIIYLKDIQSIRNKKIQRIKKRKVT